MSITLGKSIPAQAVARRLDRIGLELGTVYERLSSGMRINSASDDAASLSIASKLSNEQRLRGQALRNISDGISMLTIAESAVSELRTLSERMAELATQAANGVYSSGQRSALDREAQALSAEFSRIIASTSFNGQVLLSDAFAADLQVGIDGSSTSRLSVRWDGLTFSKQGLRTFGEAQTTSTGGRPHTIVPVDLNADGNLDLVVKGDSGAGLQILLGNGDATFSVSALSASGSGTGVTLGDFNNDGKVDIAQDSGDALKVHLGNGNGTFSVGVTIVGISNIVDIASTDLNGDSYDDLLTIEPVSGMLLTLLANSDGSFQAAVNYNSIAGADQITLGDVNNDGVIDAVIGESASSLVLLGNANGSFKAAVTYSNMRTQYTSYLVDFNADGKLDLLGSSLNGVQMNLGNGDGSFGSAVTLLANSYHSNVSDIDGDGNLDIVGTRQNVDTIQIRFGNGDGTFGAANTYTMPGGDGGYGVAFADVDSDGIDDLLAGNFTNPGVAVFVQDTTSRSGLPDIDLTTQNSALEAIESITNVQSTLDTILGSIGSSLSRLEIASSLTSANQEDLRKAYSRIIDADIAAEAARLLQLRIQQEVNASLLAHLKQDSSLVLRILRGL